MPDQTPTGPDGLPDVNYVPEVDVDQIIAQWQQENAPAEEEAPEVEAAPAAEPTEPPTAEEPAAEEPAAEAAEEAPKQEEPPTAAPAGDKLHQSQLAELARREQALRQQMEEFKQLQTQQADVLEKLRVSPVEALKEAGIDPADLAYQVWNAELGEAAPPEVKQKIQQQSAQAKLDALERKLEKQREEAENAIKKAIFDNRVADLDEQLGDFVQSIPESMPYLRRFAETRKPETALQALQQAAAISIQAGKWPSPSKLARELDLAIKEEVEEMAPLIAPAEQQTPETKATKRKKAKPISDADITSPKRQDPVEEIPWDDDEAWTKRGLLEAKRLGLT